MNEFKKYAPMPFYPGPVTLYPEVAAAMTEDFAPPRFGTEYIELYVDLAQKMQAMLQTKNEVIFPTGEAMLILWGALKSCLKAGDKVLTVGTGVFGDGFADMAESLGCIVEKVSFPYDSTLDEKALETVAEAIKRFQPVMMTAIHCETPSGTLNPLEGLGALKKELGVPLFVVDAVASIGGAEINVDAWNCDILLGGSQKCFSCPPFMSMLAVSDTAWEYMEKVQYSGYDSLLPFHNAHLQASKFPYTPCWVGVKTLAVAMDKILEEGLDAVYKRHLDVAKFCRDGLVELGINLWTREDAVNSPTVTAACIPDGFTFAEWKTALAERGLYIGGSFGPMDGKVFRLGHMGVQADLECTKNALEVIKDVMASK